MYDYRRNYYRRLILLGVAFVALLLISGGAGVLIGRYYLPNVEAWDLALEDARTQAESDYYQGMLASCVGIGMGMGMGKPQVAATCQAYWLSAYKADWYHELALDSWVWPPESPSGD